MLENLAIIEQIQITGDEIVFESLEPVKNKRKKKNKLEIFQDNKTQKIKKKSRGKEKHKKTKRYKPNQFKE